MLQTVHALHATPQFCNIFGSLSAHKESFKTNCFITTKKRQKIS